MHTERSITIRQVERAYNAKGALVLRRCLAILRNEEDANDMLHETFRRILKYDVQLDAEDIPLSFLYRTAERCCFDLIRSRKRKPSRFSPEDISDLPAPFQCDQVEVSQLLNRYFHSLDDTLRIIALMYFFDGLTQEQIATELGWSRRTIGKKLKAIRKEAQKLKNE